MKTLAFLIISCFIGLQTVCATTWDDLTPQDIIHVVWPAGAPTFPQDQMEKWADHMNGIVKSYGTGGINAHLDTLDPSSSFGGYYANTTQKRAQYFLTLLNDPTVKAIWCGRGGFGSSEMYQVLKGLEGFNPPYKNKVIIGFSDETFLALPNIAPFLHGPMAVLNRESATIFGDNVVNKETSIAYLMDILTGKTKEVNYVLNVLKMGDQMLPYDDFVTQTRGGNFSVIQRNPSYFPGNDILLFCEDTPDAFNRVQSILCGMLSALSDKNFSLFIGDWPLGKDGEGPQIADVLRELYQLMPNHFIWKRPVLKGTGFGHGPLNQVIPMGTRTEIKFINQNTQALLTINVKQYI